jgi:hypothetical protein
VDESISLTHADNRDGTCCHDARRPSASAALYLVAFAGAASPYTARIRGRTRYAMPRMEIFDIRLVV